MKLEDDKNKHGGYGKQEKPPAIILKILVLFVLRASLKNSLLLIKYECVNSLYPQKDG